ncbi:MAG: MaoC family dehydratase [Bacteroidales bacterium]|nr:MaoC family dehydratase [Bacteroidales bacterium]
MAQVTIHSHEEFEAFLGKEIGTSDYLKITQEMINKFADATLDHQWIHTDIKRAEKESPFKSTIAHGYLTVSVLPYLWFQILEVKNIKMLVNYGIEKLKFNQPVLVNDEVRVTTKLNKISNLRGITKAEINARLEIKGNPKPAYDSTIIFLYHFE